MATETGRNPRTLRRTFSLIDLGSLSLSSVGPAFSVSAAAGVMIGYSGVYSLAAIFLISVPFITSAFIFRVLNQHFPQSGASYHWSARVIGVKASRFQGWVIILAYFASLPPIVVPAAQYTIALVHPAWQADLWAKILMSTFWLLFALLLLLSGTRPTARITQLFLAVELIFLLGFSVLGFAMLPHAHFPNWHGKPPVAGILLTMVVATTILDGWEIDSYASEESEQPKRDPGLGGIIGALIALFIYAVLFPLILGETPAASLANSPDPMVAWTNHIAPFLPSAIRESILIPILASTAGSLWLTGYILIRALFSMGRDRLVFPVFATLNRRGSPSVATVIVFVAVWLITMLQLFVRSLDTFFSIILSTAGFFLTLEFMLDSFTAAIFLWKRHRNGHYGDLSWHSHRIMAIGAVFTTVYLSAVLAAFLMLSPKLISPWADGAVLGLVAAGVVFTLYPRKLSHRVHIVHVDEECVGESAPMSST